VTVLEPTRRRFIAYLVAAPTVVAAARWADASTGGVDPSPIPSAPGATDQKDNND
jgi:hypothetical protein